MDLIVTMVINRKTAKFGKIGQGTEGVEGVERGVKSEVEKLGYVYSILFIYSKEHCCRSYTALFVSLILVFFISNITFIV